MPSNLPPVGCESACEPVTTGASVVAAGTAREDVAHAVDGNRAAGLLRPGHEQVAPLAVEVGQRQAAHAALGVAPICAIAISESHRRAPLIVSGATDFLHCGVHGLPEAVDQIPACRGGGVGGAPHARRRAQCGMTNWAPARIDVGQRAVTVFRRV